MSTPSGIHPKDKKNLSKSIFLKTVLHNHMDGDSAVWITGCKVQKWLCWCWKLLWEQILDLRKRSRRYKIYEFKLKALQTGILEFLIALILKKKSHNKYHHCPDRGLWTYFLPKGSRAPWNSGCPGSQQNAHDEPAVSHQNRKETVRLLKSQQRRSGAGLKRFPLVKNGTSWE